jgi:hypothetical protein
MVTRSVAAHLVVPAEDLEALQHQIGALARRLETVERWVRAHGTGPRDGADTALLEALAASLGSVPFTCASVFRHVELTEDAALGQALETADVDSPRVLGKLLARCTGISAPVTVTRLHEATRAGRLWQVILRV